MKPREEGGVVDGRLNVFGECASSCQKKQQLHEGLTWKYVGTTNLKCIDLSICPVRPVSYHFYPSFLAFTVIGQLGNKHILLGPVGG
jgi:hypothetical protein